MAENRKCTGNVCESMIRAVLWKNGVEASGAMQFTYFSHDTMNFIYFWLKQLWQTWRIKSTMKNKCMRSYKKSHKKSTFTAHSWNDYSRKAKPDMKWLSWMLERWRSPAVWRANTAILKAKESACRRMIWKRYILHCFNVMHLCLHRLSTILQWLLRYRLLSSVYMR